MCWLTPKISCTTTRPPRGVPDGLARYAANLCPSSAVSVRVSPMGELLLMLDCSVLSGVRRHVKRESVARPSHLTGAGGVCHGQPEQLSHHPPGLQDLA